MRQIQPAVRAYLQMTLQIPQTKREEAITKVYLPNRQRFLERVAGAVSMDMLVREEDLQILVGFDTLENARAYLASSAGKEITSQLAGYARKEPVTAFYDVD